MANYLPPSDRAGDDSYLIGRGPAWFAFAMTMALMLFDYIDRQVIVSLFPHMKAEWDLSDKQLGALVSVVSVTVALGALPVALIADRYSRVKSIVVMATAWSLATISCMFTRNYGQLLAARSVVGLGEAGYGSVGAALIASIFPARMRGALLAAFFAAASVGSVVGVLLGGLIAARWGWKAAFGVVGFPGLVLALLYLSRARLQDSGADTGVGPGHALHRQHGRFRRQVAGPFAHDAVGLHGRRRAVGGGVGGVVMAAQFPQPFSRSAARAGGGARGDGGAARRSRQRGLGRRRRPRRVAPPALQAVRDGCDLHCGDARAAADLRGHRLGRPAPSLQFALIALGGFLMTCSVGPVSAIVIDVIHPGVRATGASVLALFQNLFGLAAGPFIVGVLSDSLGLASALTVTPVFGALAAVFFLFASRSYEGDKQRVATVPVDADSAPAVGGVPKAAV